MLVEERVWKNRVGALERSDGNWIGQQVENKVYPSSSQTNAGGEDDE